MFGFHWPELAIILVIGALLLGPKRMPDVSRALGRGVRDFKKGVEEIEEATGIAEVRELGQTELDSLRKVGEAPATDSTPKK